MKTGIALGLVSLFAAGVAFAQAEPVVGVKDPESLFKSSDAKLCMRWKCVQCLQTA